MTAALDASGVRTSSYEYNHLLKKFRYRYQDAGGWHSEDVTRNRSVGLLVHRPEPEDRRGGQAAPQLLQRRLPVLRHPIRRRVAVH